MSGKILSIDNDVIELSDDVEGKTPTRHRVEQTAKVTLNGKVVLFEDLKVGDRVTVSGSGPQTPIPLVNVVVATRDYLNGVLVSIDADTVVIEHVDQDGGLDDISYQLDEDAEIRLNDKVVHWSLLSPGDRVEFDSDPVTLVKAVR